MSLLKVLNLDPATRGAAAKRPGMPPPASRAQATNGHGGEGLARQPIVTDDEKKLHAAIAVERQKAKSALDQLNRYDAPLQKKIDTAQGDEKKRLLAAQAEIERRKREAEHVIVQAAEDLEALENAGTSREEMVKILARRKAGGGRPIDMEVDNAGVKAPTARNHDTTTATTSYGNGKAVVDKVHDERHLGLGGYHDRQGHDHEEIGASLTARASDEKTTHVSLTGHASQETRHKSEVEFADGSKSSVEQQEKKEIGAKGAAHEYTVTKTDVDGSSTVTTTKQEAERGEGQIKATASASHTDTSASGTSVTHSGSAGAGVIAGKDGIGMQANARGGKTVTSKGGYQAGVVAGLHANVVCKIGEPAGDPRRYPVTVTVSFGASVGVSAGSGKREGSKASVGVQASASEERTMVVTHQLTEGELGDYVKALEGASKGSKVAATEEEFMIIQAGVEQGWDVARDMWNTGGGRALTKKATDQLKRKGDSLTVSQTSGKGVGASAQVGPVGASVGTSVSDTNATTVTRNEKGGLDVDAQSAHTRANSASASMSVGVANASVGTVHTHQTSFGYSISIDPKNDPEGKLVAALSRCKSELDYETFIASHAAKVTVKGRSKGKSDAVADDTKVGIAGVELGISGGHGVSEATTTDGHGRVVQKTVTAQASEGGTLGPLADSRTENAVATVDGQGEAALTMTRTTSDNHNSEARAKRLKKLESKVGLARKEPEKAGALTSAAGGEEDDSTVHDVQGLKLSNKELRRIGASAMRAWTHLPGCSPRDIEGWNAAGAAIRKAKGTPGAVAEALARFIGGDQSDRMEKVEKFIRGGYAAVKMGKGFEFPDAIGDQQPAYDEVTADDLEKRLDDLAAKDKDKAIAECKRLEALTATLMDKIGDCNAFTKPALKGEMLHHLQVRRDQFAQAMKGYAGQPLEDAKSLNARKDQYIKLCSQFFTTQAKLQGDLSDLLPADRKTFYTRDLGDARRLVHEVEDLHSRWWPYFALLKETMQKLGVPDFEPAMFKPDDAMLKFYQHAADL